MLPPPTDIVLAFANNFFDLMKSAAVTVSEAIRGMFVAVLLSFMVSLVMDRYTAINRALYPLLIVTQTVPTIALAPILVLWFGYGETPKIILITLSCFFPIAIGLLDGYKSADIDAIRLLKTMGASDFQIYRYIKLPSAYGHIFAGLKVSASYSIASAVVAEWLGGNSGLGVYMVAMKKSYAFDKMFATIFLISAISIIFVWVFALAEKIFMPWSAKVEKRGK